MMQNAVEKMETGICTLTGVVSAHVVLNPDGLEIDEIHVVSTKERSPKQIVRDIESILLNNHGVRIDHKKISIAQVQGIEDESPEAIVPAKLKKGFERIRFVSAKSNTYGLRWEFSVELERGGIPSAATANGAGSRQNKSRLVAQATAEALNNYLGDQQAVAIDDVKTIEGTRHNTLVVILTLLTDRGEKVLVGSSLLEDDQPRAVVQATLDAINRAMT
jgi:hypothetical protein